MATKMTETEKQEFNELYRYVQTKILGRKENEPLTSRQVLRLKGLKTNKFIENTKQKSTANYSYKTILLAFKSCYFEIQKLIRNNRFNGDEDYKLNYIIKIVEPKIYSIHKKLQENKASDEIFDVNLQKTLGVLTSDKAQFKSKPKKDTSKFEHMRYTD